MAESRDPQTLRSKMPDRSIDAVVVGAGFAGMYMLHRLREMGLETRVFDAGDGVGGTWYWNRYPGARCDVESMEYSYQFSDELQQEWEWTERYATQPEILRYLNHVADRFDLRRDIQLETRVLSAHFDDENGRWTVETDDGARTSARFCIMATGCLSCANMPTFEGLEDYRGDWYHTGNWPHEEVDFTGKRVGVVGTGSSAIQSIPLIAEQAEHLHVFQRTPNFSVPAHNGPMPTGHQESVKSEYAAFRARNKEMMSGFGADLPRNESAALEATPEELREIYEQRWEHGGLPFLGAFTDLLVSKDANDTAAEFVRERIREIVDDPEIAELLCPEQQIGCKRMCVDTGYYQTFNRPNVTLVDISEGGVDRILPDGLRALGEDYSLDAIVFATGFDAMTGSLMKMDIRGRQGLPLQQKWADGPRAYLGLGTRGFPNLFTITGPGSPSVLTNMVPSIEQHVDWIADCIRYLDEQELDLIEAKAEAEEAWVSHVNDIASLSIFPTCNSWYVGANVPGKPRVFTPYLGFPTYVAKCEEVVAKGYEGFDLSISPSARA